MRFRQIHLDFHTSEDIPDVGARFDALKFASAFEAARVDSVTLFSKCHHGWSYHPTAIGEQHPALKFDLLRAQMDALQARNIKTPVYLSAGWDERTARMQPGWRIVNANGEVYRHNAEPLGAGWAMMDLSTPYLQFLCEQVEETATNYPDADGIFIDICAIHASYNSIAVSRMAALGLDWQNPGDVKSFAQQVQVEFLEAVRSAARVTNPDMPVFFNFGHVTRGRRDILDYQSHIEVESLPTAFWGYEHFPVSARYVDGMGVDYIGMTGKFHHIWGEIGGYKKPEALRYECAVMLANGARCSVGDHLAPSGSVDGSTYRIIGDAFRYIEAREQWAVGSRNVAEIGLISSEAFSGVTSVGWADFNNNADEGAVSVLLESKLTFDVLDLESDFSKYTLLILPDKVVVNTELKEKLDSYIAAGGRLLLTGRSGLNDANEFLFDVGAECSGASPNSKGDYLLPISELRASFVDDPLFVYTPSNRIKVTDGQSLGDIYDPYFNRSDKHFSGHVNTPPKPDSSGFDAGSVKGGVFYFSHPIFSAYKASGTVALMEIAEKLIETALGTQKIINTNLPRAARVTLRKQSDQERSVLHLLYANPVQRGQIDGDNVQPIQDIVPIHNVEISVSGLSKVTSLRTVPDGTSLPFEQLDGLLEFAVPVLEGHCMVEISHD